MQLWDLPTDETCDLYDLYFDDANAVIIVVDINETDVLGCVQGWVDKIERSVLKRGGTLSGVGLHDIPTLLWLNKVQLLAFGIGTWEYLACLHPLIKRTQYSPCNTLNNSG